MKSFKEILDEKAMKTSVSLWYGDARENWKSWNRTTKGRDAGFVDGDLVLSIFDRDEIVKVQFRGPLKPDFWYDRILDKKLKKSISKITKNGRIWLIYLK